MPRPSADAPYPQAVTAVAKLIASEDGRDKATGTDANKAREILWPLLSDDTRSALVMR